MADPVRRRVRTTQIATNWNGGSPTSMDCLENRGISQHMIVVYGTGVPALGSLLIEVRPQGAAFYVPIGTMDMTANGTATMIFCGLFDNVRISFPGGVTGGISFGATIYSTGLFFTVGDDYLSETDRRRLVISPMGPWNGSGSTSITALDHSGLTQHQFAIAGGTGLVELQGRPQGGTQFVSIDVQTKQIDSSGMLVIFAGMFDAFRLVPQGVVTGTINAQIVSVGELLFFNNVAQGSYGDSTHIPVITVNGGGQITSIVSVPINVAGALGAQSANRVFAGPSSGAAANPTFRALVTADIPTSNSVAGSIPVLDASPPAGQATITITGPSGRGNYATNTAGADGAGVSVSTFTANGGANTSGSGEARTGLFSFDTDGGVANARGGLWRISLNNGSGLVNRLVVTSAGVVKPGADNAQTLGESATRWSVVYAATGTINTSDSRQKTVTGVNTLGLDFVNSVNVSQFKFIVGYNEVTPVPPNPDGSLNNPILTPVPGDRIHLGTMAQNIHDSLASAGVDPTTMGMWILEDPNDPTSMQGLRENELMWVLWTAVQQLSAQVKALQQKVGV